MTTRAYQIPIVAPTTDVREVSDAFSSVIPEQTPVAARIIVTAGDNVTGLDVGAPVDGWTDTYDESTKTITLVSDNTAGSTSTQSALDSIDIDASTTAAGTLSTKIEWNALISWTIEEVMTIAGGTWPAYYSDNVAGVDTWTINTVSMCPENTAFYFIISQSDEGESTELMHMWVGYKTTQTVVFDHISTQSLSANSTELIGIDADTCLLAYVNGDTETVIERLTRGSDDVFTSEELINIGAVERVKAWAANSTTDLCLGLEDEKLYFYDGTATLTVLDTSLSVSLFTHVRATGTEGSYVVAEYNNTLVIENRALTRVIANDQVSTSAHSFFLDVENTTAHMMYNFDLELVKVDYSGDNSYESYATVVNDPPDFVNVRGIDVVGGFAAGDFILNTTNGDYDNVEVRRGRLSEGTITSIGIDNSALDPIVGPTLGVPPEFHSNNGTGLVFSSGGRVGVYSIGSEFEVNVLRDATDVTEVPVVTPTATVAATKSNKLWTIVGAVLGSLAGLMLLIFLVKFVMKKYFP